MGTLWIFGWFRWEALHIGRLLRLATWVSKRCSMPRAGVDVKVSSCFYGDACAHCRRSRCPLLYAAVMRLHPPAVAMPLLIVQNASAAEGSWGGYALCDMYRDIPYCVYNILHEVAPTSTMLLHFGAWGTIIWVHGGSFSTIRDICSAPHRNFVRVCRPRCSVSTGSQPCTALGKLLPI